MRKAMKHHNVMTHYSHDKVTTLQNKTLPYVKLYRSPATLHIKLTELSVT